MGFGTGTGTATGALRPLLLTGFGLGAFLDGIVLHQVLQWHHLVSARIPVDDLDGLQANTLWDGVFHLASWLVVLVGLLWTARSRAELGSLPARGLAGPLLVGWGVFQVVDQLVFHLLLEAHHIRPGEHEQLYDWGYTAMGVALVVAGLLLSRSVQPARV